jgi:phosphomannomutase
LSLKSIIKAYIEISNLKSVVLTNKSNKKVDIFYYRFLKDCLKEHKIKVYEFDFAPNIPLPLISFAVNKLRADGAITFETKSQNRIIFLNSQGSFLKRIKEVQINSNIQNIKSIN